MGRQKDVTQFQSLRTMIYLLNFQKSFVTDRDSDIDGTSDND